MPESRRPAADRLGALVYQVIGRYIAGSVLVAVLAGLVMLIASLALGVPLAPLIARVGRDDEHDPAGRRPARRGAVRAARHDAGRGRPASRALAIFLVYQNIENHVIQPVIVGRAVKLSPPATMVAALIGVSAGGVVGGAVRGADPRRVEGDLPLTRSATSGHRTADAEGRRGEEPAVNIGVSVSRIASLSNSRRRDTRK